MKKGRQVTAVKSKNRFIPDSVLKKMPKRLSESGPLPPRPEPRMNPFEVMEKKRKRDRIVNGGAGKNVLQEIRRLQNNTDFLLPKMPFNRLVREICTDDLGVDVRWTSMGL